MSQQGGTLAFDKLIGKLVQSGGVIELRQSLLEGTLQQGSQAQLGVEIAGASSFSRLEVTQSAEVNGEIHVSLTGGYDPLGGEQFEVLAAGDLDINSLALSGPDAGRFSLLVGGDTIVLQALAPLAGDYNADGLVDAADYTVWRDGGSPDNSQAGYDLWVSNYGATTPASSTAVPEPAAGLLLLVAIGLGSQSCHRRLSR